MIRTLFLAATLLQASPAAAQTCVTTPEAEALALVVIPEVIRHTGTICAGRLPTTSLVRQSTSAMLQRYDAAAERAWPIARGAIVKLSDPALEGLLELSYARSVLVTLVAPMVVGRIAIQDCGMIDRLVTQLEPLPPRNTAGVLVTALHYLRAEKAKGKAVAIPELPLCNSRP